RQRLADAPLLRLPRRQAAVVLLRQPGRAGLAALAGRGVVAADGVAVAVVEVGARLQGLARHARALADLAAARLRVDPVVHRLPGLALLLLVALAPAFAAGMGGRRAPGRRHHRGGEQE